jgi:hypothetical protein
VENFTDKYLAKEIFKLKIFTFLRNLGSLSGKGYFGQTLLTEKKN